jgi:hypothetical protein
LLNRQTRLVTIFALVAVLFNGLSGLVAARSLGNLQFSAFTSSLAIITTLQIFFQGLQFSTNEQTKDTNPKQTRQIFVTEGLVLTTIVGVILFLCRHQLNATVFQSTVICLMVFPGLANASVVGYFLSRNDFVQYQFLATFTAGIRIFLTFTLLGIATFSDKLKSPAMFIGLVLASNVVSLLFIKIRMPQIGIIQSRVLTWGTWNSVVSVSSGWLLVQGDLILFHAVLPAQEAGKISAYSSIAKILISLIGLIGLTQTSRLRNFSSSKNKISVILKLTLITCLMATIALYCGSFVIRVLYGEEYVIEQNKLPLLILSNSIWAVFSGLLYIQLKLNNDSSLSKRISSLLVLTILALFVFPLTYENILKIGITSALFGVFALVFTRTRT